MAKRNGKEFSISNLLPDGAAKIASKTYYAHITGPESTVPPQLADAVMALETTLKCRVILFVQNQ